MLVSHHKVLNNSLVPISVQSFTYSIESLIIYLIQYMI